jgi:hypothetical protein
MAQCLLAKRRRAFSFFSCSGSSRRPIVAGASLAWSSARCTEMQEMKKGHRSFCDIVMPKELKRPQKIASQKDSFELKRLHPYVTGALPGFFIMGVELE